MAETLASNAIVICFYSPMSVHRSAFLSWPASTTRGVAAIPAVEIGSHSTSLGATYDASCVGLTPLSSERTEAVRLWSRIRNRIRDALHTFSIGRLGMTQAAHRPSFHRPSTSAFLRRSTSDSHTPCVP